MPRDGYIIGQFGINSTVSGRVATLTIYFDGEEIFSIGSTNSADGRIWIDEPIFVPKGTVVKMVLTGSYNGFGAPGIWGVKK